MVVNLYITIYLFIFFPPFPPPPILLILSHLLCICLIPGMIHVDQRFKEIKAQVERGETVKGGLLTHMLTTMEMSVEEIYANVTEMLLAGVDTVCV